MSSAEQHLYVAVWEYSSWGKMVNLSMSLHISQSQFCVPPTHLHFAKLIRGRWLAQNLRESLQNSPGTAYCRGGNKAKCEDEKGLWWHFTCWGCSDAQCMSESELMWILLQPAGPVQSDSPSSHLPLPSHAHTTMQVLQGLQVQCQELRWQNDQGEQGCETSSVLHIHSEFSVSNSQFLLELISCSPHLSQWLLLAKDTRSSRCLSDNPLSGEGRFVWGWRACDRGINVEHRYPDISGRCL